MQQSGIRSFIAELRRRRVVRVGAVYAVVAWALIEVADVVGPALGLPAWTTTFVVLIAALAFPIALILAWAFELTPDGVRRAEPTPSPTGRDHRPAVNGRVALIGGLALVLVAGGAWWAARPAPPPDPSLSTVAVLPFSYRGADALDYLGAGMIDLLATNLNGAGELRAVDPHGVASLVGDESNAAPGVERGRALARRLGAGLYVIGSLTEVGGGLRATARLLDLDGVEQASAEASAAGEREVFRLVDELARQLLAGRFAGTGEDFGSLAARTTHSLPALKAYLEGQRIFRTGDWSGSLEPLQRAIAADSSFALAYYRLALAESWLYERRRAQAAADSALHYSERLPPHERRLVRALRAYMYGHADEAEWLYREIVARYPEHAEAWYQLGETLIHYNPMRGRPSGEAREAFERAAALAPAQTESLIHLVQIASAERRLDDLRPLLDELLSRNVEEPTRYLATRAFALGDSAAQDRLAAEVPRSGEGLGGTLWELAVVLGDLDATERLARAWAPAARAAGSFDPDLWIEIIALARGQVRPDGELALQAAVLPFRSPDPAELRAQLDSVRAFDPPLPPEPNEHTAAFPAIRSYLLGLLTARLGDLDAARRHAATTAEMTSGIPEADALAGALAHGVRAEIALREGRPDDALRELEATAIEVPSSLAVNNPFYALTRERFLRAELLSEVGRHEEALRWFATVTDRSSWGVPYLAPTHLGIARILDAQGEAARAADHYAQALALWENADPELQPVVADARRRLASLVGEGRP